MTLLILLAIAAFVAGFVDSIAGGGGLISLPALLLAGLDPVSALATNKLQGSFGTASATHAFRKKGHIELKSSRNAVITTFIAAAFGVSAVSLAPKPVLEAALPVILIAVALYFALAPRFGEEARRAQISNSTFASVMAPLIGFYDGLFGPGTGSFFMLALVTLCGLTLIQATAKTKLLNFTSNIAALMAFALTGKIFWTLGLMMGTAQFAGAQLGSHFAMKSGARIIRPLLVIICCAIALKLLSDPDNPLRSYFRIT